MNTYFYDDSEEPDNSPDEPDIAELYLTVDAQLMHARPERYVLNNSEWMETTVQSVEAKLREQDYTQVIRRNAWGIVKQREGVAKRRLARFFRELAETGQAPIGWGGPDWQIVMIEQLSLPVPISECDIVRLGAVGYEDLTECELYQKRRFEERELLAEKERTGIAILRSVVQNQGVNRVDRLTF